MSPTEVRQDLCSEPVQPQTSHHKRCFGPWVCLYLGGATRILSQYFWKPGRWGKLEEDPGCTGWVPGTVAAGAPLGA